MTYSGFNPAFPSGFTPGKVNITNLKYGSPIGGLSNQSYPEPDPLSFLKGADYIKAKPEEQAFMRQHHLQALQGRDTANLFKQKDFNIEGITAFMKEQAGIAEGVARRKLGDERISRGIDALAGGLQTALAGGSPEMLAFNAQAPLRAQEAYVRNAQNRQRQEIPVIAPPSFMSRNYFS